MRQLTGVGDATLGEWREWTGRAFHLRRRLSAAEQRQVGDVVDVRRTAEAARRADRVADRLQYARLVHAATLPTTPTPRQPRRDRLRRPCPRRRHPRHHPRMANGLKESTPMSTSTNAVLFYGYIWTDECDLFPNDEDEPDDRGWEEILLERRGTPSPWREHPNTQEGGEMWMAANEARIDEWSAAQKAIRDEYRVDIGRHGADQWSVPYIHIADTAGGRIRAARGYPQQVTAAMLAVGDDWDERLTRFTTDLGIDITGGEYNEVKGPGWFLASWWG